MSDIDDAPAPDQNGALPPDLRFLKTLVTVLTGTMILGLITVIALLVIRLRAPAPLPSALPAEIRLPQGVIARAVTFGPGWYAVVSDDAQLLIYDSATGHLRKSIPIGD